MNFTVDLYIVQCNAVSKCKCLQLKSRITEISLSFFQIVEMLHKLSQIFFISFLNTNFSALAKGVKEGPYEKGIMDFSIDCWLIYETQISKNMVGVSW